MKSVWQLSLSVGIFVTLMACGIEIRDAYRRFKDRKRRKQAKLHNPMIGCWGRSFRD